MHTKEPMKSRKDSLDRLREILRDELANPFGSADIAKALAGYIRASERDYWRKAIRRAKGEPNE